MADSNGCGNTVEFKSLRRITDFHAVDEGV